MYINWFNWIIFIHDRICYTKIRGNKDSPDSLNAMVSYHYHGENRVTTRYLPFLFTDMRIQEQSFGRKLKSFYADTLENSDTTINKDRTFLLVEENLINDVKINVTRYHQDKCGFPGIPQGKIF